MAVSSSQMYVDRKWKKMSKKEANWRCCFTKKCVDLAKEQRARFYIMRRCVTMLICWREYRDS